MRAGCSGIRIVDDLELGRLGLGLGPSLGVVADDRGAMGREAARQRQRGGEAKVIIAGAMILWLEGRATP